MNSITELEIEGYEQVARCDNCDIGFTAWIAVHDTTLGPALGGCRLWNYDDEAAALTDVLRLSKGMTYKNALAGLELGGGKGVIRVDPATVDRGALFSQFGRFVASLKGKYITAEDVNSTLADMTIVKQQTEHVATVGASGNPSPFTAFGVFCAIQAVVGYGLKRTELAGMRVAVQGVGETGGRLAELLAAEGVDLIVADVNKKNIERLGKKISFTTVPPEDIYDVECDIFAPCALGGILNDQTIPRLRCSIVVGSANNQLLIEEHGDALRQRGILYAPDFIVNAGGVINISCEIGTLYDPEKAKKKTAEIGKTLTRVLDIATRDDQATNYVANRLAEEIIHQRRGAKHLLLADCAVATARISSSTI